MHSSFPPIQTGRRTHRPATGFTLIEILVVMGMISVLLALVVPAFNSVNTSRQMKLAAYDIQGLLDTARAYAKANNTYTWVGFYEEDASTNSTKPATAGTGRVVVSTVASKDGTAMYPVDGDQVALTAANLVQIGNLVKIGNVHLDVLTQSDVPSRTVVTNTSYQVGSTDFGNHMSPSTGASGSNQVTFNYPLSGNATAYTFVKVIQFNPLGDATKIVESPTPLIEIGLRPTRSATVDAVSRDKIALQIAGIGGAVRMYQP